MELTLELTLLPTDSDRPIGVSYLSYLYVDLDLGDRLVFNLNLYLHLIFILTLIINMERSRWN